MKKNTLRRRILNPRDLRIEDWQANDNLVSKAAAVVSLPDFKLMLSVLRTESPSNYGLPQLGVSAEDRAAWQARTEGYHACLNNIEALAELKRQRTYIEPTYENTEKESDE